MHIDTHSRSLMEESVYNYFGVTASDLSKLFARAGSSAQTETYFDGWAFDRVIDDFIEEHLPSVQIDSLLFFHLSRRLKEAENEAIGQNLFSLLETQNAFTGFLANKGIKFVLADGHYEIKHRGKLIKLDKDWETSVSYLRNRLGYNGKYIDSCFNGFAFRDLLNINSYMGDLSFAPEFINILATYLNRRDIIEDYFDASTYYCFEYRVPFERVIFDGKDSLSNDEKKTYLLNQVLHRLFDYSVTDKKYLLDTENPALRLSDTDTMPAEYFVSKQIITPEMIGHLF